MRPPARQATPDPSVTIKRMKTHQMDQAGRDALEQSERNKMLQMVTKDEAIITSLIDNPENDPTRIRFPERIFRENFLPFITGDAQKRPPPGKTAEQLEDEARQKWLSVSRGPLNEVDVVDQNDQVVFTMPAFFPTANLNTLQRPNERPLKTYTEEYRAHAQSIPHVGKAKLQVGLDKHLSHLFSKGDDPSVKTKLDKVYEYYGIKPTAGDKPAQEGQGRRPVEDLGEMFYD